MTTRIWRTVVLLLGAAWTLTACKAPAALTQQADARRLAADLHVQLTKAIEAGNRAVMANEDESSSAAAKEAEQATQAALRDVEALKPLLESLGYGDERQLLEGFIARFDEFRKADSEILSLAVENSNLKAQRLSFGPSREAVERFRNAVDAAARTAPAPVAARADALAARAIVSLLDIQALQAPHIAEAEDDAMTKMEAAMTASESAARRSLAELKPLLPPAGVSQVADAVNALDRFKSLNAELIALSRRNSEVRSLALSLGRKRMIAAACDDQLRALEDSLDKHRNTATR